MSTPEHRTERLTSYDCKILAFGAGLGVVFVVIPPISFLLHPLATLFHELGHTVAFWAFGYPAIPSFDFLWGGGVTMGLERQGLLVLLLHLALGVGLYRLWTNSRIKFWPGLALALLYLVLAWSPGHRWLISFAGHLATLILAGVFVAYAYRGVLGERSLGEVERPLFMASGLYVYLAEVILIWGLATSEVARDLYRHSPKGINDLRPVSRGLGLSLEATCWLYLLLCLVAPMVLGWVLRERGPDAQRLLPRQIEARLDTKSLPDIWPGDEENSG